MKKEAIKKSKFFILPVFSILFVLGVFAFVLSPVVSPSVSSNDAIQYHSSVCRIFYDSSEDTTYNLGCGHNTLFNTGAEDIEQLVSQGATGYGAFDYIYLCNATAGCGTPSAGATEDYNEYSTSGLDGVQGTTASNGNGNWSTWYTFTATADNLVTNVSRLGNASAEYFAGNAFTSVTLQTSDQLTINWTIWVS